MMKWWGPLLLLSVSGSVWARFDRSIYGKDDRLDAFEKIKALAEITPAVAMQIYPRHYTCNQQTEICTFKDQSLSERLRLCPDVPFAQQISVGECTGFLLGPKHLLTAGHCLNKEYSCKGLDWIFKVEADPQGGRKMQVEKKQIYHCTQVLKREINREKGLDIALIELDRPVRGVKPLPLAPEGTLLKEGASLWTIGHPDGLPMKYSTTSVVIKESIGPLVKVRSDNFHGGSGSPLLDPEAKMVMGLLVRGQEDHHWDDAKGCFSLTTYSDQDKAGEEAVTTTAIHQFLENVPGL